MPKARALCSSCDIYCQVLVETEGGKVSRVKATDPRPGYANICMKGVHAPAGFAHPERVLHPLRRKGLVGRESGNGSDGTRRSTTSPNASSG